MELYWQDNNFWYGIEINNIIDIRDIDAHIYSTDYLKMCSPAEFANIKNLYNNNRIIYFFEVEKYSNEEDYEEVFYQRLLENDISPDEYYNYENAFVNALGTLSSIGKTYIYFNLTTEIESNYPLKRSDDVEIDRNFIKSNNGRLIQLDNDKTLKSLFILSAREIISSYFIFPQSKIIVVNSGMHGYLIADEKLDEKLLNGLSNYVNVKIISNK